MAGTAKDIKASEVHQQAGDLWIIGVAPTDLAVRLTIDADGTPDSVTHAGSVHLGATEGEIVTTIEEKMDLIEIDQADAPVAGARTQVGMSIEATLKQTTMDKLQHCLAGGTYDSAAGYKQVTVGGKEDEVTPVCVAAISRKRTDPTKFVVSVIYMAVPISGGSVLMGKTKASTSKVKFQGLADLTRAAGQQVGVLYTTE